MASGLVQKTVGDGNSGTFAATFLSSDGTGSGHLTPTPTLYDSSGNEISFTTGTAGTPAGGVSTVQGQHGGMTPVATNLAAAATGGSTLSGTQCTASTNATSVKASAGVLHGGQAINTTGTIYYLRFYNLATAPTPSSATGFVLTVPVPANTTGAGVLLNFGPFGGAFSTGIAFCVTGGPTSTDNSNAASGVFVNLAYQ